MIAEDVAFSNYTLRLAGTLYKPDSEAPYPAAIVLHAANGGTRTYPFYQHLTARLPARGVAVLLYDRRGFGQSTGDFATSDFEDLAEDAIAAVDYLRSREDIDKERMGVYGISQGGWIAPIVAARKPAVAFLIIVSGCGVSPAKQMDYGASYALRLAGFSEAILAQAIALRNRVNEYYRGNIPHEVVKADIEQVQSEPWFQYAYVDKSEDLPEDVTQDKWYYELDYDPLPIWQQVQQPTLFVFAEHDRWVPISESLLNFGLVTTHLKDVTIVQIEGTDHLMVERNSQETAQVSDRYVERLIAWLTERVGQD